MSKSKWPQVQEAVEDGRISTWLGKGLLEKTIAKNLGVSVGTWEKYKVEHPELREAIKKGNRVIVREVEDALVKRALGFEYTETKITRKKDPDGRVNEHTEIQKRYSPPDVGACCFILKNKDKDHWKNDPALSELREMELQLRRQIAEGSGKIWPEETDNG